MPKILARNSFVGFIFTENRRQPICGDYFEPPTFWHPRSKANTTWTPHQLRPRKSRNFGDISPPWRALLLSDMYATRHLGVAQSWEFVKTLGCRRLGNRFTKVGKTPSKLRRAVGVVRSVSLSRCGSVARVSAVRKCTGVSGGNFRTFAEVPVYTTAHETTSADFAEVRKFETVTSADFWLP